MKFEISLDADEISSAIEKAYSEDADNLYIIIEGEVDKTSLGRVIKLYITGECNSTYEDVIIGEE